MARPQRIESAILVRRSHLDVALLGAPGRLRAGNSPGYNAVWQDGQKHAGALLLSANPKPGELPVMDHDRLFKELLTTFFVEFLELFYPELAEYLAADSVTFLDKELFTDLTQGERHEADLVVRANFRDQPLCFLIHVETQSHAEAGFARRMFSYFARLYERHDLPVYPIAVFSYDQPQRPEPDAHQVAFPDLEVLSFRFRALQLNQLDWKEFVDRTNPIAAALMARMRIVPDDPRG